MWGRDFLGKATMARVWAEERNAEGQMTVDFAKKKEVAVVNSYFKKREKLKVT